MPAALNLIGQKFGLLTVHSRLPSVGRDVLWFCTCACGGTATPTTTNLRSGNTKSCGCRKRAVLGESTRKHGLRHLPEYGIWKAMNQRCHNPNSTAYKNYGARGIFVCPEWRTNFHAFFIDMGPRPAGFTIDRVDNDGPYSKENCIWASKPQQARNTRRTVLVSVDGETRCFKDWADLLGITTSALYWRAKKYGAHEAISRALTEKRNKAPWGRTIHL